MARGMHDKRRVVVVCKPCKVFKCKNNGSECARKSEFVIARTTRFWKRKTNCVKACYICERQQFLISINCKTYSNKLQRNWNRIGKNLCFILMTRYQYCIKSISWWLTSFDFLVAAGLNDYRLILYSLSLVLLNIQKYYWKRARSHTSNNNILSCK